MTQNAFAIVCQANEQHRPETMEQLLAGVALVLPMLDVIPNAAIFIKDVQARYVMANQTLVQRCGLKHLQPLLGRTSAEVFPEQLGPGYTEQDRRVLEQGFVLEDQLELHLQGKWSPDGRLAGAEALTRWNHPDRGEISPADFIPVAEDSGLILPLGRWVIEQACVAVRDARAKGHRWPIAINVMVTQTSAWSRPCAAVARSGRRCPSG